MTTDLTKQDVLRLHALWDSWLKDKSENKQIPEEFRKIQNKNNGLSFYFALALHSVLSMLCKLFLILRFNALSIYLAKLRVKYDCLYWEPKSCGLSNAYTDMGIGYFQNNEMQNASFCLEKSWQVYPCPHNTSFGFRTKLAELINSKNPDSKEVKDFIEIRKLYKT